MSSYPNSYPRSFYIPSVPNHITPMLVHCIFRDNLIGDVNKVSIVPYMCKHTYKTKNSVFVHMNYFISSEKVDNFLDAVQHKTYGQNRLFYLYGGREYYLVVKPYTSKSFINKNTSNHSNTSPKQRINLSSPINTTTVSHESSPLSLHSNPNSLNLSGPDNDVSDISVNTGDTKIHDHDCDDDASSLQDESLLNEKCQRQYVAPITPYTQEQALVYDAEIVDNKCVYQAVPSGHTMRLRTAQALVDVSITVSLNEDPDTYNELPIVLNTHCKLHHPIPETPPSPLHAPPSYCFY
jgi:hypothetical protein